MLLQEVIPDQVDGLLDAIPALSLLGFAGLCVRIGFNATVGAYKEMAAAAVAREQDARVRVDQLLDADAKKTVALNEANANASRATDMASQLLMAVEHMSDHLQRQGGKLDALTTAHTALQRSIEHLARE